MTDSTDPKKHIANNPNVVAAKDSPGKLIPVAPSRRERLVLKGDAMMDTIFFHGSTKEAEPALPDVVPVDDPVRQAEKVAQMTKWRAWANFRYVGDPTKRLFTGASGFKGGYEKQSNDMGVLPADQTMTIQSVVLELRNVDDPQTCRDILDHVTLGLMINNAYEWLEKRGLPEKGRRRFMVLMPGALGEDDRGGDSPLGAHVAARMGFYVTALIGRKAKDTLEATHGAHLLVQLEGTLTRDVEDAPKEGGAK